MQITLLVLFRPPSIQATAYITAASEREEGENSEPEALLTEAEAVRSAVVQRIEFLDANFLAALNGYVEVCTGLT